MKWADRSKAVTREEALEALLDGIGTNVHVQLQKAFAKSWNIPLSIQKPESSVQPKVQSDFIDSDEEDFIDSDEEEKFEDSDCFDDDYYDSYC